MDERWVALLWAAACLGMVALVSVFAFARFFSEKALRRRALARQARREYDQARGTMHKRVLSEALREPQQRKHRMKWKLQAVKDKKEALLERRRQAYLKQAQRALVMTELTSIPGIGPKRAATIQSHVFRGSLADLHRAQRLPGIGWQNQSAISAWVRQQEQRLPSYIEGDFAGKGQVTAHFAESVAELEREIAALEVEYKEIAQTLEAPEAALARLEQVTPADFVRVRLGDNGAGDALDGYLSGVFAEWEAVPSWFSKLVSDEAAHDR